MAVPALIFLACFGVGVVVPARQLPDLDPGRVGAMAFFATCGLLGVALSLVGLHAWEMVRELEHSTGGGVFGKPDILAGGLVDMLTDAGIIAALACAVYLLAPPADPQPDQAVTAEAIHTD